MRSYFAPSTFCRITFFAPLASRTRSSLGRLKATRLDAVVAVAAGVDLVADRDRRFEAALEVLVLLLDRKVGFHLAQMALVDVERRGFLGVAQHDIGFERGLRAVQRVGVGLVGADHHFDRRVLQVHPRQLGLEIIVGPERLGAQRQELLEARVGGDRRGLLELLRGGLQPLLIFLAVRHRDELVALRASPPCRGRSAPWLRPDAWPDNRRTAPWSGRRDRSPRRPGACALP